MATTTLTKTAQRCRRKFLRFFPGGFGDETYFDWERGYKQEAHERWAASLGEKDFRRLLKAGQFEEIARLAVGIESRTNLLFSFEKMALRDAVRLHRHAGARPLREAGRVRGVKPRANLSVSTSRDGGNPMKIATLAAATTLVATTAFAGGGLFDSDDCKYTAPRKLAVAAAGITKIVIHADAGFLKVDGQNGAGQIVANGTACTSDDDFLPRMTLTSRRDGSELHITADIPDKTVIFGFFQARLDFSVTMPAGLPVMIDDDSGLIHVANSGALTIDDDSGAIELRNIRGPVVISDDSGGIDIDTVNGSVKIEDDSGEIIVKNVTGNVEIEDDSGSITVARVSGFLRVHEDDSGSIVAENIRGDVTVDDDGSGSIQVADVGGNFTVGHKGSGGIDYERVAGRVRIPERFKD